MRIGTKATFTLALTCLLLGILMDRAVFKEFWGLWETEGTSNERVAKNSIQRDHIDMESYYLKVKATESKEAAICPRSEIESDDSFSTDVPQKLERGRYHDHSARPFLGPDVWYEIADNKRVFFIRPIDDGFPPIDNITAWVASRSHPITLLINNQQDFSFPRYEEEAQGKALWKGLIEQDNLHAVYAYNMRSWEEYPKIKPLPIGLKWNWKSPKLFSEDKRETKESIISMAASPEESKELFESKKEKTSIFLRPLTNRRIGLKWKADNNALRTNRYHIKDILNQTAPLNLVEMKNKEGESWSGLKDYYDELKRHRFVICPPGGGLDTHCTWEAFIAGTIPILPTSPLDPQFEGLPVWLVSDWNEVTDEAALRKSEELANMKLNWKMAYAVGWKEKIYEGLCQLN